MGWEKTAWPIKVRWYNNSQIAVHLELFSWELGLRGANLGSEIITYLWTELQQVPQKPVAFLNLLLCFLPQRHKLLFLLELMELC